MALPHLAFNRQIGEFAGIEAAPDGRLLSPEDWRRQSGRWLPSADDGAFIQSLMAPERAAGAYAGWIAPPKRGIDNRPGDFEYVRTVA